MWGNFVAYSKICTHAGCPASLYEQQTNRLLCPCHQSQFLITDNARPIFGPASRALPQLPIDGGRRGLLRGKVGLPGAVGPDVLGAAMKRRQDRPSQAALAGQAAAQAALDDRFQAATPLRRLLNKVFPDHWSFLLGEIALYSFIVLLLTGTFLALFFDPSMTRGRSTTAATRRCAASRCPQAYETSLHLSFDVRGGLFMRQMHHWAALLFMAAIVVHMFRVFFTGAFRKPREANWIIGVAAVLAGLPRGLRRLLAAGRRAVRHRPAHRLGDHAVDPGRRHLGDDVAVRRRVPRHVILGRALHPARAARSRRCLLALITRPHGPGGQAEAHPVARPRPDQPQRGRRAHVPAASRPRPAASS